MKSAVSEIHVDHFMNTGYREYKHYIGHRTFRADQQGVVRA